MSSLITSKPNPFQRSNPFQVQSAFTSHPTPSFTSFTAKPPTYRPYQPQPYVQKQNNFLKKAQNEVWKFRQDNCGKPKVFGYQTNSILHEKYVQEKNSFEKQLVLSSVGKRNQNVPAQETVGERQPIENPFGRKYLIGGNALAESQVYSGFRGGVTGQQNLPTYERIKTEYEIYTPKPSQTIGYNYNYPSSYTPAPIQDNYMNLPPSISSNQNLQTSLYHKNSQFASRKSIERSDSYNRNSGSYHNLNNNYNGVESRYSLEKDKDNSGYNNNKYNSIGSNKDINPPYPSAKEQNYSRSSIPLAQRDRESQSRLQSRHSRASQKEERVNFQNSDQQASRNDSREKHRQPTFGSKKEITQLPGPEEITIHGMKFYRQKLQCY